MANTQALCSAFKVDVLNATHAFNAPPFTRTALVADTFQCALYLASATLNASTTQYSATGEVPNSGSYTAGGIPITWSAPSQSTPAGTANQSSTAFANPSNANIQATSFTATAFDTVLVYNATAANKNAISVNTFGSQTITAGTFTLTFPANAFSTALIRNN